MGYVPEDIVEKIKSDIDILDLIGEYVTLKKAGKDYIGLCPFHREKTPSFTVVPSKGFYYCFGCGASGNAIGFVMRHENLDYPEALKFLAKKAGITIPETGSADSIAGKLYKATEYAHGFFRRNMKNSTADEYIKSRGASDEIVAELEIGYAPAGWDNLYNAIKKDKLSLDDFDKAGLIIKSDKGPGYYDKFRNRLIFPIKNISGRVVGFGGRALNDEDSPKYLNSPETQIYHKGSILYGLNWAKNQIRNSGKAIIAEGYFDFISLYQAGIKNVVAVSGTGFTLNQGSLLARFCSEVILLYDADSAGMKATFRAVEIIFNSGLEPYVVRLPQGSDPDSYIRDNGVESLSKMIGAAVDYLEFVRQSLPDKFNKLPISRQEKVIKSLVETASGIEDDLRYALFVRKAVETLDLPAAAASKFQRSRKTKAAASISDLSGRVKLERSFLGFLLANPEYIKESIQVLKSENFIDKDNREVFITLKSVSSTAKFTVGDLLEQFHDDGIRRKITEIIVNETAGAPPDLRFNEFIEKFKNLQISDRLNYLLTEIAKAEKEGDINSAEKLTREYQDLRNVASRKVV
jgi:DNA primase